MARYEQYDFINYLQGTEHPKLQTVIILGSQIPYQGYRYPDITGVAFNRYVSLKEQLLISIAKSAVVDQVQWADIYREAEGTMAAEALYAARGLLSDVVQREGFQTEQNSTGQKLSPARIYGFRVFWGENSKERYEQVNNQGPGHFDFPDLGKSPRLAV